MRGTKVSAQKTTLHSNDIKRKIKQSYSVIPCATKSKSKPFKMWNTIYINFLKMEMIGHWMWVLLVDYSWVNKVIAYTYELEEFTGKNPIYGRHTDLYPIKSDKQKGSYRYIFFFCLAWWLISTLTWNYFIFGLKSVFPFFIVRLISVRAPGDKPPSQVLINSIRAVVALL